VNDIMGDQIPIRLRPVVLEEDCKLALKWYQDPEVIHFSEGPNVEPYGLETVQGMYEYLNSIGKLMIIEVFEDGEWVSIGDVTFSKETIPIVIGDRKYRSRGIGTEVIKKIIELAKKEGWKELKVKQVFDYNKRSHRMFSGLGFVVTSEGIDEKGNRYKSYKLEL
jgi:RimJ/RimL family protein N-acetyltransferase